MTEFNWLNYSPAAAEIFLAVMCLFVLLVGAFVNEKIEKRAVRNFSILSLALTFAFVYGSFSSVRDFAFPMSETGHNVTALAGMYVVDSFTTFMKLFIIAAAILSLSLVNDFFQRNKTRKFEYDILILLSVLGGMVMVSAQDMIMMYIGLELMSFSLYILTAFQRSDMKSSEAGLKYFILGSLASGLLLFGMSYVYGITGTTSFDGIQQAFANGAGFGDSLVLTSFAMVLVLTGVAFKMSAAPFHMWTPDVYEGAPTPVTAYMAVVPKVAALAVFVRLLHEPFMYMADQWQQIVIAIAILSMAVGSFMAIVQSNIKRLLAYSSIANVGFMLVPVATTHINAIDEMLAYLVIYSFMTLGTFGVVLSLRKRDHFVENIDDLKGLSKTEPALAAALAILMFSLAGVPPFAGFIVKLAAFKTAVEANMAWLAILGVIFSVVSAYYCLRIVKVMYFEESKEKFSSDIPFELKAIVTVMVIAVIGFGLFSDSLNIMTNMAIMSLTDMSNIYG